VVELGMVRSAQSDTMLVVAGFVSFTDSSVVGRGLARVTKGWDPSAQIPSASGWIPFSQSRFSGLIALFSTITDELES
jgi:hypothetical protein